LEQKFANFSKEAERAKNDIQSAMDDEIECNIGQKDSKKSSSQLAMEQKIKDHLRELDSKATRKEAGHMVISSDEQGRVQKTVKANRRKVVKSEMEGGDDWLLL